MAGRRTPPPSPGRETPWGMRPRAEVAPAREDRAVNAERSCELRLYGLNAVRAVFARRPQAFRKLYLSQDRIPQLQPLL